MTILAHSLTANDVFTTLPSVKNLISDGMNELIFSAYVTERATLQKIEQTTNLWALSRFIPYIPNTYPNPQSDGKWFEYKDQ